MCHKYLNKMKKYIHLFTITAASIFAISCNNTHKASEQNLPVINVKVNQTNQTANGSFISVSGKIQAVNSAELSTRIMGYVTKSYVAVGDKVKKGQLLLAINNTDLQAKKAQVNAGITEATAAFNNAQKDYNRYKNLFQEQSVSQKEMDNITTNFEMAKARLEAAKQMKNEINAQFNYSNISAPFDGVITNMYVKVGDMANPGMPLISIENPNHFEVVAMVPETEISNITKNTVVDVLVKSVNKTLKGKVTEISNSSKNSGGQYLVKISLDNLDVKILSGMFTTVQFPYEKQTNENMPVLVPTEAIVTNGQLTGIYTPSQSHTAILRWIRLGRTYGEQVEVLSGLNADEKYIVSADGKLFNGAKISIQ